MTHPKQLLTWQSLLPLVCGAQAFVALVWVENSLLKLTSLVILVCLLYLTMKKKKGETQKENSILSSPGPKSISIPLKILQEELRFAVFELRADLIMRNFDLGLPGWLGSGAAFTEVTFFDWFSAHFIVSQEDLRSFRFQLSNAFGMDEIQWSVSSLALPKDALSLERKYNVRLRYFPKFFEHKLQEVTVVLQDASELKVQEDRAVHQRREMEKMLSLLQVEDSLFELFMAETRKLFEEIKGDLKQMNELGTRSSQEAAIRMFRSVHTIKANAKLFRLESIQEVAHDVENFLEQLRSGGLALTLENVQQLRKKIGLISDEIYSYASLRKEIVSHTQQQNNFQIKYRVQWIRSLMNQFASILRDPKFDTRHLNLIQKEFSRALMSFDKASLRDYVRGYNQMIQEVARQSNKEIEDLETDLEYHHFDSDMLARINDIILHCLRNAIDHGIESNSERIVAGKAEKGRIRLATREEDGIAYIEVSDNGRGIDIEKVKAKAVELGLVKESEAKKLTDSESLPFLFHPGVSTAASLTEISGRGLGMDIVRDYVQSLNGQISISFQKGRGTTFAMWIPTANQEYLTPLAVYDLRDLVADVLRDFPRFEEVVVVPLQHQREDRMILFCDRLSVTEILRRSFQEMYHSIPERQKLKIEIQEFLGRRRVDSYNFFRIKFGAFEDMPGLPSKDEHSPVVEQVGNLARKAGGSLFLHHPYWMEINLPSNIPMHFAEYEFHVLVFMSRISNLSQHVESFFKNIMGGWKYHIFFSPFPNELPAELKEAHCLVLLDSLEIPHYLQVRAEADRIKDGVVLFPERDLDVDILNESAILPENLLFIPPSFDEKHLHRCLAGVIFRRFLKDMVREPVRAEQSDSPTEFDQAS